MATPEKLQEFVDAAALLDEFGAMAYGFDPGVVFNVKHPTRGGDHTVSLQDPGWLWLQPLLEELRDRRAKEKECQET